MCEKYILNNIFKNSIFFCKLIRSLPECTTFYEYFYKHILYFLFYFFGSLTLKNIQQCLNTTMMIITAIIVLC